MAEKSDFTKMLVKDEELPLPALEKVVVPISSLNDHPHKTTTKRKSNWTLGVIHKKARKGDPSSELDETTEEEDDEEIELRHYVEPDKKYFFVHLAKIACKLCSFKGKLIVQHYRMSHPESEVLISRINPDIAHILIEDAIRNREEYDKDHPELEEMTCNFKCPFCLMLIKDTPNMYYNHISSHTGEYCFHCDHCSYWTYSHTNIQSHLNQMHSEIHKAEYKMVYPNPKILKYVFGHICSECNFIQLIRTTVEEHAMIYHPGTPEIHRVNLGLLPHEDAVSKSNLKIPTKNKELNIEEVMIKVESKALKDDPLANELTPFIYQPDLDIKQDYESDSNLNELVPPYNCEDDGFPNCLFKTLYFDEYLKHVVAIHQINGFSSFSSEDEPLRETIMEGWLAKEVGPFQCGYCKRATVTYQEMGRHQVMFHAQKQSSFYYRKFVPSDSVIIPEQVNVEDPSFINHVIHLPDQAHLCDFKLTGGLFSSTFPKGIDRASEVLLPEEDPKVDPDMSKLQCNWKDCYQIYLSQTALVKHIEKNHIERKRGEKYTCFWTNCPNKMKPFNTRRELLMHMRVHSGEKPYKCPFQGCNKAFSQMGNLRVHQKGHTGERPHFCQFSNCLKKFSSIYDRDKHQETHYNTKFYACQVTGCSKRYIYLGSLKVHMRIHEVDEQRERKSSNSSDSVKHQTLLDEPVENKEGLFSKQPSKEGSICDDTVVATELIDEVQHKCNCGKEFATIALLKSHAFDCIQKPYEKVLLSEDSDVDPNLSKVSSDEDNKAQLFNKVDPLCLDNEPSKDGSDRDDTVLVTELTSDSQHECHCGEKFTTMVLLKSHALDCIQKPYRKLQCNWKDCYQTYHSQTGLVKHIEKNHIERKSNEKYICFWINCLNKMKPFNTRRDLRLHMRVHSREKPHKCPFQGCNKAFSRMGNLTVHQKLHTGEKPHICQFSNCFKKFSSILDRDNHQRTHYNTKFYACQVPGCSKWFTLLGSLQDHMKIHEVDQQLEKKSSNNSDNAKHQRMHYGTLQCKWEGCFQPYHSEKIALVKHIKTHVKLQRGKKFTCLWYNCPRKLKPFNTKQYLLMHMKVHSGEKPYKCVFQGCKKTFSQSYNLKVHQRRHMREKPYSCEFSNCCKSFFELSHKIAHQRTHKDTKRYACQASGCSKTYTNPHRLRKHMENHMVNEQLEVKQELDENNQKEVDFELQSSNSSDGAKLQRTHFDTLQCKWKDCYQIYHSQTALVEHIENHVERKSGEKYTCFWINCSRTSKPFRKRYSLLVHMRVHSREKPYKCPECNRAFSRLDNLKTHGRSHTGEKPYSCQFPHCFMSFSSMSERGRHHRKHYNTKFYACQVTGCLKKFTHSSSLQAHMKNHTVDEKLEVKWNSVENEQNEGDFVLQSSSNDSELTYYNDKPYTCQVTGCSKKYTDPSNLRRHMKKSHTVNKQFEAENKSVGNEQKEDDLIIYHL